MRPYTALVLLVPALLVAQPGDSGPVAEQVARYAEARMGTKVGRGECWDLAMEALNSAGARWNGAYIFGEVLEAVDVERGCIVQFEQVVIEHRSGTSVSQDTMGPHTAIVLQVLGPGHFLLAHQNFGPLGRKVSRYELVLADVVGGSITFFMPVR